MSNDLHLLDMQSAPRDGTEIVIQPTGCHRTVAFWDRDAWRDWQGYPIRYPLGWLPLGWLDAAKVPPPKGRQILVCLDDSTVALAQWDTVNQDDGVYLVGVTHWLPIPDPPKEAKHGKA